MKKNILYLLLSFIFLLFNANSELKAQATCQGGPTIFTEAQIPNYTAASPGNFGNGTVGFVQVCITAANIGTAMCSGTAEHIRIRNTDGTLLGTVTSATVLPVCFTSTINNGLINVMDYCATGTNNYTLTWQTVIGGVNQCAAPTCIDGIMNGDETGIDCGGATCVPCGAPTCSDLVMNQDETGIDCGGATCPPCPTAPDGCTDAELITPDGGCQTGTTTGASDSWSGTVGCQSADGHADVWYEFTSTGTNADFTVTNGTQGGDVEIILVTPNCTADNCTCPFALVGTNCGASPLTASFNVTPGGHYFYTISSTGANGTFTHCLETNTNVAPGQDCNTAQTLCVDGGFSVGNLQNGIGAINESTWFSCATEQNTQWYTFSAATSGTFAAMVTPTTWTSPATGDDYDFTMLDITAAGCTAGTTTELACDFSPCQGSTGFSATGAAGFGQTAITDFRADDPAGPANCTPGTAGSQWNTTTVNLVAGNTYTYMIQNYTGSTGGATVTFGGTASLVMDPTFTATVACYTSSFVLNSAYTGANWTYLWDFGDGIGTSALAEPTYIYSNTVDSTYNVSFTMTNGAGCVATGSASVTTGCVLPIKLLSFTAKFDGEAVGLNWITASEINNDFFTIERSKDGVTFEVVGIVDGAENSSMVNSYNSVDKYPYKGTSYYRLKQTDYDGNFEYFKPVAVTVKSTYDDVLVYPNPVTGNGYLTFSSLKDDEQTVVIYDVSGRLVYQKQFTIVNGNNKLELETTKLTKGMYFIKLDNAEDGINLKFIKE